MWYRLSGLRKNSSTTSSGVRPTITSSARTGGTRSAARPESHQRLRSMKVVSVSPCTAKMGRLKPHSGKTKLASAMNTPATTTAVTTRSAGIDLVKSSSRL